MISAAAYSDPHMQTISAVTLGDTAPAATPPVLESIVEA